MIEREQTIKEPVSVSGVGLHTGLECDMTFRPAPIKTGIRFIRADRPGAPEILADIDHVVDLSRGTSIEQDGVRIHTVEHVLAAVAGLSIDNIYVELTSKEPPVGDGSALPFVEALLKAGIEEQDAQRDYLVVDETLGYSDQERGVDILVFPSDEFRITFLVDYNNPALGTQYTSMHSLADEFVEGYASARTFCFLHEVEELHKAGLIKGGTLDNAIVIVGEPLGKKELERLEKLFGMEGSVILAETGVLNGKALRFKNEPVRHKTLDLIGDLALLGVPIKAHVIAAKSGHAANIELVRKLRKLVERQKLKHKLQVDVGDHIVLDTEAIQRILPHRYPFLLVDRVVDLVPRESVVAIKNVTSDEPFFVGHFPGHPIMPGVLIIEAMAQTGGILLLNTVSEPENKLVYLMGVDHVKFRQPVTPGDQLRMELTLIKLRGGTCKMRGKAYVKEKIVAEAEILAQVRDADTA